MTTISNITEYEQLIAGDKPVVIEFYADWCPTCKALLPVLEAAGNDYADIVVAKSNVETNTELAEKFSVKSIPAVFLIKNGTTVDEFKGIQSRAEINKRIDHLISANIESPEKKL